MKSLLTPRELSDVMGVSESSVRRWVDAGHIPMKRTAGGHRRIALEDALRYLRETQANLSNPQILGLESFDDPADETQGLYKALLSGEALAVRSRMMGLYLSGVGVSRIFDGAVKVALQKLIENGKDARGKLVYLRGVEMLAEAVNQIRLLLQPAGGAPLAAGGSPSGDTVGLPSMLWAATLASAGFRERNLGADIPVEPLADYAIGNKVKLVWLTINAAPNPTKLSREIDKLCGRLDESKIPLVLGGKVVKDYVVSGRKNVQVVHSHAELGALARGMLFV